MGQGNLKTIRPSVGAVSEASQLRDFIELGVLRVVRGRLIRTPRDSRHELSPNVSVSNMCLFLLLLGSREGKKEKKILGLAPLVSRGANGTINALFKSSSCCRVCQPRTTTLSAGAVCVPLTIRGQ